MAKNILPEIVKMLGVEPYEKFRLLMSDSEECEIGLYYFDENYCLIEDNPHGDGITCNNILWDLCSSYAEIIRLPWEPKLYEEYWSFAFNRPTDPPYPLRCEWRGDEIDYTKLRAGVVYRTKEGAEANMASDFKKLTGKDIQK